ncbi:MAG: 3-deoxy-7-phosphoheptulonate synthase [Ruminiclostridium sp.]
MAMMEPVPHRQYLYSLEAKAERTKVKVGPYEIGGHELIIMAGPCAVEDEQQILETAEGIARYGGHILRGGAFKPRTSPYSFQGMGREGLKLLRLAKEKTSLPIITEVMDIQSIEKVMDVADILQVGARNMQNFPLLKRLGRINKPILLKRGISSKVEEWLMSAEYILSEGNNQVILCERGIRTFETATRNTLDLSVVPLIKSISHLPIIVDPSHGTGIRSLVSSMAKAAVIAGADGLLLEVHPCPEKAVSDGNQSLNISEFAKLMEELKKMTVFTDKSL